MAARILIVDDEESFARTMQLAACRRGYDAMAVHSYEEAVAILERETFDIGLIDYIMPINGIELSRHIRKYYPHMGTIIISAVSKNEELSEEGIGSADKYVPKCKGMDAIFKAVAVELLEKAPWRATRESAGQPGARALDEAPDGDEIEYPPVLELDPFLINLPRHKVLFKGQLLRLNSAEFLVLYHLGVHTNIPVPREHLVDLLRDSHGQDADDRRLENTLRSLRQKIEEDPKEPTYLRTIHGVGILLSIPMRRSPEDRCFPKI